VLALPPWAEGGWQLRVRAVDLAANRSRPALWSFGLTRHAPPTPRIAGAQPAQGAWGNVDVAQVRWSERQPVAPLRGYQYRVWSAADGGAIPGTWALTTTTTLRLANLQDGDWTAQVRALDQAGNTSPVMQWSFHLDREHPLLTTPVVSGTSFTPPVERLHLRFGLSKEATISFSVFAAGKDKPILTHTLGLREPGQVRGVMWDGRITPKHVAPAGSYTVAIDAVDHAGNRTEIRSTPVTILDKRIVVSVSKDALWAYQGDKLILHTLVTNGGPDTPTLPGIFHVQGKYRGWVMHSPWPKGSPLWYPDSLTNFALLYNPAGGYFLHDAPWRYNFGPGSNSVAGIPGGSYTGTHGCTNVPYDAMVQLFDWADVGTLIDIVR
jgi:lipoprotein-anchoring transpeptidase ErfK/SrfK